MKTYVIVAPNSVIAERVARARGLPRKAWRRARDPVDLAGLKADRILLAHPLSLGNETAVEQLRMEGIMAQVKRITARDRQKPETVET